MIMGAIVPTQVESYGGIKSVTGGQRLSNRQTHKSDEEANRTDGQNDRSELGR